MFFSYVGKNLLLRLAEAAWASVMPPNARMERHLPESAHHLEDDNAARDDLVDVAAREELLGYGHELWPFLGKVVADDGLERGAELNSQVAGRRRGQKLGERVLERRAVRRVDGPLVGSGGVADDRVRGLDPVLKVHGTRLADRSEYNNK